MKSVNNKSRRTFLQQSGALLSGALLMNSVVGKSMPGPVKNNLLKLSSLNLGNWLYTSNGLPVYQYTGPVPFAAVDKNGKDALLPQDPFFILGNYRCTLFAHASGIIQFLTGERAWARINAAEQINYGDNMAKLSVSWKDVKKTFDLIGINSSGANESVTKKFFGTGFCRYEYRLNNQVECTRILSVKPSVKIHSGNPSVVITILIKNTSAEKITVDYIEKMAMNYLPVNLQRKERAKRLVSYPNKFINDTKKQIAVCAINYSVDSFLSDRKKNESNFYDTHPASVFMQVTPQAGVTVTGNSSNNDEPGLSAIINTVVMPGETKTYHIVIGLTYNHDFTVIGNQVKDLFLNAEMDQPLEGLFSKQWKKKLPDLAGETNAIFKREMLWNAYTLECMATYSDYFKETYIPQGMLYTYQDGENISNRDHAQAMLPMCYTNPDLAKSSLRYVMKHTTYIGEIKRGSGGFGYIEPNVYQESDEQLYLFMSISEYLRVTKDYQFLNETVTYYPAEYQKTDMVVNLLKKHFIYLRDVVSTGRNGLIRILNSDWSDSFFHKYSPNLYAGTAESVLNTTMALAVLPNLIQQLKNSGESKLNAFITAVESYRQEILKAFLKDFGERDFAARCYLNGSSTEKLGMDHVCIEPQGYLLQMPEITIERKRIIYSKVKAAIGTPEKIGFRSRELPMWNKAGEGEDGGTWFSLEGSVVAGVVTFDKKEAWSLLEKMSFHNFSKQYPGYWVGHWTAPDFINSTLSAREGLYTFWEPDLKEVFKGYCSHPHSWPLYLYFKLKESFV